jgi:F-type H+-transporting ATPase subunit alpha
MKDVAGKLKLELA